MPDTTNQPGSKTTEFSAFQWIAGICGISAGVLTGTVALLTGSGTLDANSVAVIAMSAIAGVLALIAGKAGTTYMQVRGATKVSKNDAIAAAAAMGSATVDPPTAPPPA